MKEKAQTPIYKKEFKLEKGKLIVNNQKYVPVPKDFSDALVDAIKNGGFWEDIISFNGEDYMEERRFAVYKSLSESLKKK